MTPLNHALSDALVQFVWQGLVVGLALYAALQLLRNHSARVRYALSCSALTILVALPVLTIWSLYDPASTGTIPTAGITITIRGLWSAAPSPYWMAGQVWFVRAWLFGTLLLSFRLVLAGRHIARIRRSAHPAEVHLLEAARRIAGLIGARRAIRVLVSPLPLTFVNGPSVIGWLRPAILLPAASLLQLSPAQLEAILAHELAHLRRYDDWVNVIQIFAETLIFYHPAVWWVSGRVRHERELCCDDIAVAVCGDPVNYARALTKLEKLCAAAPGLAPGATGSSLRFRIERLIGMQPESNPASSPGAGLLALCLTLVCFGFGASTVRGDLQKPQPLQYPESARAHGIQGTVPVDVRVDSHGAVREAKAVGGSPGLRVAAAEIASTMHLSPGISRVNVAFQLAQASDASVSSPPNTTKRDEPGSIAGRVTNALTGEPLRKATVLFRSLKGLFRIVTDDNGRYEVPGMEPESWQVTAQRVGFRDAVFGADRPGQEYTPVVLNSRERRSGVDMKLFPQSTISGRVTNSDGEAIPNQIVAPMRIRYIGGKKNLDPFGTTVTDDRGQYRITVSPGRYYVLSRPGSSLRTEVTPPVEDRSAAPLAEAYVPTYYPNVPGAESAAPVDVTAGASMTAVDIRLLKMPVVSLRGRVVNETAYPTEQLRLSLDDGSGFSGASGRITRDGRFEYTGLRAGHYTVRAEVGARDFIFSQTPVDIGKESVENLTLVVRTAPDVTGNIRVENGDLDPQTLGVSMRTQWLYSGGGITPVVTPAPDGSFRLHLVNPNRYIVLIDKLPPGYYLKSVMMGGQDFTESGVDLTQGAPSPVDLVISGKGATVSGFVTDGKGLPVVKAAVALVPLEISRLGQQPFYRSTNSGADGGFRFQNLSPGSYKAYAWETVENRAWVDADFLKPFEASGVSVRVSEGESPQIRLKAIPDGVQ